MQKRFLLVALAAFLLPATAGAAPIAQLDGPGDGCMGGVTTVTGKASWATSDPTSPSSWDWELKRGDNGAVLQAQHGTQTRTAFAFDTRSLPATTIIETLKVTETPGGQTASAQRAFTPIYDRTPPARSSVETVYAVSARQVWLQASDSSDPFVGGCGGGPVNYGAFATESGQPALPIGGEVDGHAIKNGVAHELLSLPVLTVGKTYRLTAVAADKYGNVAEPGTGYNVTTDNSNDNVVAGQVKSGNALLQGQWVTASGQATRIGLSDANGWYRLLLPGMQSSWQIQYGPACTWSWCDKGYGTVTDNLTTPFDNGVIVPKNRSLPAG